MPAGSHDLYKIVCVCICLNKHFTVKSVWKWRPQRLINKNILQGTKRKLDYGLYLVWFLNDRGEREKQRHKNSMHAWIKTDSRHCHSQDTSVNLVAHKEAICMLGGRKEGGWVGVTQSLHEGLKCPCQSFSAQWEAQETLNRDFRKEFLCPQLLKCTQ